LLSDAEVYILENTRPLEGEEYQLTSLGGKYMKRGKCRRNSKKGGRKFEERGKKKRKG
jgi:hypothetical protein